MATKTTKKSKTESAESPATPARTTPKKRKKQSQPEGADVSPGQEVTFRVMAVPARPAQQKTIRRLMRMQTRVQTGLNRLSKRRQRDVNDPRRRAGRIWVHRAKTTKLTHVAEGESFTITVTPQILPDIRSVLRFLEVSAG